ncbi:MAG: hypothetical protein HOD72_02240 [Opitutae bacterium]|nr:hypothetical protein [Opitutae bacterium]MBT4223264.1 hypothetical protein [Opitutae bacterium]MBT5380150.1 hypothetical protein [Opitutae bacterium]MBT5691669.1 hypothetical protein [Opitutae bacterium]MBT6461126.1 hypothetical protein [Opitutae bacterium]
MLTKRDRIKNKSGIFMNYRIEFTYEGDDILRERYFNAQSEEHAREMLKEMLERQNINAEILSVEAG